MGCKLLTPLIFFSIFFLQHRLIYGLCFLSYGIYSVPGALIVTSSYIAMIYKYQNRDLSEYKGKAIPDVAKEWIPNDDHRHSENGFDFYVHIDGAEFPSYIHKDNMVINSIKNAIKKWDNIPCTQNEFNLIIKDDYPDQDIGYAEFMFSDGKRGKNQQIGDIVFGGFLNFPKYVSNSKEVLAATIFFDYDGNIIDFPKKKKTKIGFVEIYFNDYFKWDILSNNEAFNDVYDIETVAMHEIGHALLEEHVHDDDDNDSDDFIMENSYFGVNKDLESGDIQRHCELWGNWKSQFNNDCNCNDDTIGYIYNEYDATYFIGIGMLIGALIMNIILVTTYKLYQCYSNHYYQYNKIYTVDSSIEN